MRIAAVLMLLLWIGDAFAATKVVSWTNPTQWSDGTALTTTQLVGTRVEYGTCGASGTTFGSKQGEFSATGSATSATSPNLGPGTYCFRAFAQARFAATGTGSTVQESLQSNVTASSVPVPTPTPPTGLSVADPTAYEMRTSSGALVASRIGYVQPGTLCSGETQKVGTVTYNRIELRDTDLYNVPTATTNLKVWARCS